MSKLTQRNIESSGANLRLRAKLQSVQWKEIPDELKALMQNLKEIVTGEMGHGGYSNHMTTLKCDGKEYTRLVQTLKSDPKFIPSVEVFISPEGFCHFHIVLTFVGTHDEEVDTAVAKDIVNFICSHYEDPGQEITIVIHRRWKKTAGDKKAMYTTALWGNESLTGLNERLCYTQQQIALKLKQEHKDICAHLEQVIQAGEMDPKKMEEYKDQKLTR